ncbi:hypothetical protein [Myroides odoratus]|nr:hypothetical protein [Myroides odoratus]
MKTIKIMGWVISMVLGLHTAQVMGQEVEVSVLGGLTGGRKPTIGLSDGSTVGFSALYMQEIRQNLSLGVGLEVGAYQLTKEDSNYKGTSPSIDGQGAAFEFRYTIAKFKEELRGNYFAIPIKVQYVGPNLGNEKLRLYAAGGVKYQIYTKVKSTQTLEGVKTSGYYEQWDAELHNPTYAGFGNLGDKTQENKLKLNSGFFVMGELGVKYDMANNQALYLGFYGDCDLGAAGQADKTVLTYKEKEQLNSILPDENERYKLRMFTLGIKVKYSFGL